MDNINSSSSSGLFVTKLTATKWLKKADISGRIKGLRAEAEQACAISREQLMDWLVAVIFTGAQQINLESAGHPELVQSHKDRTTNHPDGSVTRHLEVTMPSKIAAAAEMLANMCGWMEPQKVTLEAGNTVEDVIQRIRKQRG